MMRAKKRGNKLNLEKVKKNQGAVQNDHTPWFINVSLGCVIP
ncbi:hypothetical protein PROSTU_01135 [Providencia stuartii ATCC 25827]|uniref:Uncharacterized protein n=1 Tax=Providencia stuartii ATCC 25827 TaxID=471874 RepID=A0AA87CS69_PROST|nr:hypothetical protein PROSTU_01135 [Providencia stuartii ATCC 25827]